MKDVVTIMPIGLYILVGIVSLIMAGKCLLSNKFLSFHEKAANLSWEKLDINLRQVILALMRISGLGFLVIAILLLWFPIINYFKPDTSTKYAIPGSALIFCSGLFLINYVLYKKTKASTPWKGSLAAVILLILGMILSAI